MTEDTRAMLRRELCTVMVQAAIEKINFLDGSYKLAKDMMEQFDVPLMHAFAEMHTVHSQLLKQMTFLLPPDLESETSMSHGIETLRLHTACTLELRSVASNAVKYAAMNATVVKDIATERKVSLLEARSALAQAANRLLDKIKQS